MFLQHSTSKLLYFTHRTISLTFYWKSYLMNHVIFLLTNLQWFLDACIRVQTLSMPVIGLSTSLGLCFCPAISPMTSYSIQNEIKNSQTIYKALLCKHMYAHTHTHTPVRWPQSNLLYFSWYSFLSFFSFKTTVNVLLISKSAQNMFSLSLCISHFYPISLLIHLWGSKSHTYFKTGPMCNPSVIFELIITARVVLPWDFLFF